MTTQLAELVRPLPGAEEEVVVAFESGEAKVFRHGEAIQAAFVRRICIHAAQVGIGNAAGLRLEGVVLEGKLDLEGMTIPFPLWLRHCTLDQIRLSEAHLTNLHLGGSTCRGIIAGRVTVAGSVRLTAGFEASARIWMPGATIGGDLDLTSAVITTAKPEHAALLLDGARIAGRVFLRGGETAPGKSDTKRTTVITGRVSAKNARFDGGMICTPKARFCPPGLRLNEHAEDYLALDLSSLQTHGWVAFGSAVIEGGVELGLARIGGQLSFQSAKISNGLDLEYARVEGNVHLGKTSVGPAIRMTGLRVEGSLLFGGADLSRTRSVTLAGASIGARLEWRQITHPDSKVPQLTIDLSHADVGVLDDDPDNWASADLVLEGLTYQRIALPAVVESRGAGRWRLRGATELTAWLSKRLQWLNAQPADRWSPDPYGQLGETLRRAGHDSAATGVFIERERRRRTRGGLSRPSRAWSLLLGAVLGHGYRPWRALIWAVTVIAIGAAAFGTLDERRFHTEKGAPPYSAIGYSADAFLPIVDLHQESQRSPLELEWNVVLWIHIGLGWILTTLGVAGVTGLVTRR